MPDTPNNKKTATHAPVKNLKTGGKTILELKTTITWKNCEALRKKIEGKIQTGRKEILLDFKRVELLDSAALEVLIKMHDMLMEMGGALKLVGLNEVCRDILIATRIINILFVYKDINQAISHKTP